MRRPVVVALALVWCAASATGCQEAQDPSIDAGTTTSSTPVTTAPAAAPPISTPAVAPRSHLTALAVGEGPGAGGTSRIVFEFDGPVPGYRIDYLERPVQEDGSGDEVEVAGEAVLEVRFENSGLARIEGEEVIRTYTGPDRVPATGAEGVALEAVDAGDFEGLVTWVVGLRLRVPALSATTLTSPSRLVLDLPAA